MILLIIQFGWIRTSIEVNRRHFADRMIAVSNTICQAFYADKALARHWLSRAVETRDLLKGNRATKDLEDIIKHKLDSVLLAKEMPLSADISGRTGNSCYLMNYVPAEQHSSSIDHSAHKLCLCNHKFQAALDIGFDLVPNKMLVEDSSGLILPSVILILLLTGLFAYIIFVINRQKSLAELKNDFINNLTHEFNTPLFSIGITSNLLLRSDVIAQSEKLKGYVELISTEKNRLQTQVDKILRLTAIEAGSLILESEKINAHTLIEENMASFATTMEDKGGHISFIPGATNPVVKGDPIHLFNVISNLLDNAIKYADRRPEIVVTTTNTGNELLISIADNGIGMDNKELSMIFDKFYRVKHGDRHDVKGFGLGLSYVKKVIELHGGTITVKSTPGKGTEFVIHLPGSN